MSFRKLQQGWREFICEDCGANFKEATRDIDSPSGEGCITCGIWLTPAFAEPDNTLERDGSGNLTKVYDTVVIKPGKLNEIV